jgi:hypothetical protein
MSSQLSMHSRFVDKLTDGHVHQSILDPDTQQIINLWLEGHVSDELLRDTHELIRHMATGHVLRFQKDPDAEGIVSDTPPHFHAERKDWDWFQMRPHLVVPILRRGEFILLWPKDHISQAAVDEINWEAEQNVPKLVTFGR